MLYADAAVTSYTEKIEGSGLTVILKGIPDGTAQVVIWKPGEKSIEDREVTFDSLGKATAIFK